MANYSLSNIIKEYLIQIGDSDMNRAARFYSYGVSYLRESGMDLSAIPKTIQLTLDDNNIVNLPDGFLNYLSVNAVDTFGNLVGMARNEHINLALSFTQCGAATRYVPPDEWISTVENFNRLLSTPTYLANHFRNGENFGAYFNAGGINTVGQYKIDYNTNQMYFSAVREQIRYVILEYITDIESEEGDYIVHPFLIEALKAYLYWKSIERDRNFNVGSKQYAENVYRRANKTAIRRYNARTMDEWTQAFNSLNSGVAKFSR